MEPGLEGLSLRFSTSMVLVPAPLQAGPARGPPSRPWAPPPPPWVPHPRPGAPLPWGLGRDAPLPERFPGSSLVARGNRRPAPGPARRQLQGTAPGPAACSQALPPPPPPRCHRRPLPAPCAPARLAPEPGRPLAHVGRRTAPPPPMVRRGLALATPPRCPAPSRDLRLAHAPPGRRQPRAPAGPRAACTCAVGPRGPHLREAVEPASSTQGRGPQPGCT